MTLAAVADTHSVIWYVFASPLLSSEAKNAFDRAAAEGISVGVSAVSLAEMVYLIEKNRIAQDTLKRLMDALANPDGVLLEVPLDSRIVDLMPKIPRNDVPDFPDRIVAATALFFGVPIITRDARIRAASVATIW